MLYRNARRIKVKTIPLFVPNIEKNTLILLELRSLSDMVLLFGCVYTSTAQI